MVAAKPDIRSRTEQSTSSNNRSDNVTTDTFAQFPYSLYSYLGINVKGMNVMNMLQPNEVAGSIVKFSPNVSNSINYLFQYLLGAVLPSGDIDVHWETSFNLLESRYYPVVKDASYGSSVWGLNVGDVIPEPTSVQILSSQINTSSEEVYQITSDPSYVFDKRYGVIYGINQPENSYDYTKTMNTERINNLADVLLYGLTDISFTLPKYENKDISDSLYSVSQLDIQDIGYTNAYIRLPIVFGYFNSAKLHLLKLPHIRKKYNGKKLRELGYLSSQFKVDSSDNLVDDLETQEPTLFNSINVPAKDYIKNVIDLITLDDSISDVFFNGVNIKSDTYSCVLTPYYMHNENTTFSGINTTLVVPHNYKLLESVSVNTSYYSNLKLCYHEESNSTTRALFTTTSHNQYNVNDRLGYTYILEYLDISENVVELSSGNVYYKRYKNFNIFAKAETQNAKLLTSDSLQNAANGGAEYLMMVIFQPDSSVTNMSSTNFSISVLPASGEVVVSNNINDNDGSQVDPTQFTIKPSVYGYSETMKKYQLKAPYEISGGFTNKLWFDTTTSPYLEYPLDSFVVPGKFFLTGLGGRYVEIESSEISGNDYITGNSLFSVTLKNNLPANIKNYDEYMWFDIDQEYPGAKSFAISVTSSGASDYILNGTDRSGSVSGNDISLSLHIYDTLVLSVNASGHPLYINTANTTGTGSQVNNPSADNNGSENGTITWTPTTSGTYYYNCQYHASMSGIITVTE